MKPYIGITGLMTPQESRVLLRRFDMIFLDGSRQLQVGVLASSKTLSLQGNKYPNRYPRVAEIRGIFQEHHCAFNVLHYSTDEPETLRYQLMMLANEIAGPFLHGLQLNIAWPEQRQLRDFHAATKNKYRIILQLGKRAINDMRRNASAIATNVASYQGVVSAVLIDESGGTGHFVEDMRFAHDLIMALKKHATEIDIGYAGGLRSGTLHLARSLLADYPELNLDAESGVRDLESDDLDLFEAVDYIKACRREILLAEHICRHREMV